MSLARPVLILLLAGLSLAGPARAQAPAPADAPAAVSGEVGSSTRAWLDLQGRNAQPGRSHPVPGEVAGVVWKRYVDSFRGGHGSGSGQPATGGSATPSASGSTGGSGNGTPASTVSR